MISSRLKPVCAGSAEVMVTAMPGWPAALRAPVGTVVPGIRASAVEQVSR